MDEADLTQAEWNLVHRMAKELGSRQVSHNLVRQAGAYARAYPNPADLQDWLARLVSLGATFASGREDTTSLERTRLKEILGVALEREPRHDWPLLLAWTARLMLYYTPPREKPGKQTYGRDRSKK